MLLFAYVTIMGTVCIVFLVLGNALHWSVCIYSDCVVVTTGYDIDWDEHIPPSDPDVELTEATASDADADTEQSHGAKPNHAQEARRAQPSDSHFQPHLLSSAGGLHHPGRSSHKGCVFSMVQFHVLMCLLCKIHRHICVSGGNVIC